MAVGGFGTILTSADGTTWVPRTSGIVDDLSGVTFGSNTFTTVGGSGTIFTSPDGVAWTFREPGTFNHLFAVAFKGNSFVTVGQGGTILQSIIDVNAIDFNDDGRSDILWRHGPSGTVAIWIMDGLNVTSVAVVGAVPIDWDIMN